MYRSNKRIRSQNTILTRPTEATFQSLVDAIIPVTPLLAERFGDIQLLGALSAFTYEYMIWTFDEFLVVAINNRSTEIPLAEPIAETLNLAADELVAIEGNQQELNYSSYPEGGTFAALSAKDRFRAITLLYNLEINLEELPPPFKNNPDLVLSMVSAIGRFPLMGYYSEWSGYGSTRLLNPSDRIVEYFPMGWRQVAYPGPARGYYGLLRGFVIEKFSE